MVRSTSFVSATLLALVLLPAIGRATPGQSGAEAQLVVATKGSAVRDGRNRPTAQEDAPSRPVVSEQARLSEYIEMHGRATDHTGRASLMPWSALKQMSN